MGASRQWQIEKPRPHTVRVQYARHSNRLILYVDGVAVPVEQTGGDLHIDDLCEYQFEIDGTPCRLSLNVHQFCRLWIGDELQPDPFPK